MACNGWQTVRLGDVCLINPEKRGPDWPYKVMEYIDISSVGTGILNQKPEVIAVQDAPSRAQRLVRNNDVIVSTVRPNRRSFLFLKNPKPNTVVSTGFVVLRATDNIDPRFLYYVISTQDFTDYLEAHTEGSAYPAVSVEVFEEARVKLPPLPEQRAIAHILGTLDDKIELNRRMNETLEAIARAIFKSWFVDFDPVLDNALKAGKPIPDELAEKAARRREVLARAQAEGLPAGLPEHLARLFPDEFVESELGWVPKGWDLYSLAQLPHFHYLDPAISRVCRIVQSL